MGNIEVEFQQNFSKTNTNNYLLDFQSLRPQNLNLVQQTEQINFRFQQAEAQFKDPILDIYHYTWKAPKHIEKYPKHEYQMQQLVRP